MVKFEIDKVEWEITQDLGTDDHYSIRNVVLEADVNGVTYWAIGIATDQGEILDIEAETIEVKNG